MLDFNYEFKLFELLIQKLLQSFMDYKPQRQISLITHIIIEDTKK